MTPSPHPPTWDAVVTTLARSDEVWQGVALVAFATNTLRLLRGTDAPASTTPPTAGEPPPPVTG